jgi:xanthine/CO dehydrogenase XdhC/CoxF family maturation factor
MCCGGDERVPGSDPRRGSRVRRGLHREAAGGDRGRLWVEVTVVDAFEWTGERFPTSVVRIEDPEGFARALATEPGDYVVIVTHDHAPDQRLVQALIQAAAVPGDDRSILGSGSSRSGSKRGFGDTRSRAHTPLGSRSVL